MGGPPLETRFPRYTRAAPNGCLEWTGKCYSNGYGSLMHLCKYRLAHRVAWELAHGPIPEGMVVCHACDNRKCVRVEHLFLGTQQDNMNDAKAKGRMHNPCKGSKSYRAKLTEAVVLQMRAQAASGVPQKDIAAQAGVSRKQVSVIVSRKQWAHI